VASANSVDIIVVILNFGGVATPKTPTPKYGVATTQISTGQMPLLPPNQQCQAVEKNLQTSK